MSHTGEPVGDAGALLGDLLEDPGPSVADDVVVALHVEPLAYTLPLAQQRAVERLSGEPGRTKSPARCANVRAMSR
jgi:hypothetical protein